MASGSRASYTANWGAFSCSTAEQSTPSHVRPLQSSRQAVLGQRSWIRIEYRFDWFASGSVPPASGLASQGYWGHVCVNVLLICWRSSSLMMYPCHLQVCPVRSARYGLYCLVLTWLELVRSRGGAGSASQNRSKSKERSVLWTYSSPMIKCSFKIFLDNFVLIVHNMHVANILYFHNQLFRHGEFWSTKIWKKFRKFKRKTCWVNNFFGCDIGLKETVVEIQY